MSASILSSQIPLGLPPARTWGGKRPNAGRKRRRERRAVPHRRRAPVSRHHPVHVTLRMARAIWNLRSRRCHRVVSDALRGVLPRADFRVVHYSVQGDHIHLIVEADHDQALSRGVNALACRLAKGLNRLMGRQGRVLDDRHHRHVLRTPAEVRHAVRYVLQNFARHAARRGDLVSPGWIDPYSSASYGRAHDELHTPPTQLARCWLLTVGWRRATPGGLPVG